MRTFITLIFLCFVAHQVNAGVVEKGLTVKSVRHFSYAAFTRIVFEVEVAAPYILTRLADGRSIMLGSYDGPLTLKMPLPTVREGVVKGLELREEAERNIVVVHLDGAVGEVKDFTLRGPDRIVIDIMKAAAPISAPTADKPIVIALDPGHGGKDAGIVAPQGDEKTLTLDLAFAISKLLRKNPRLKVVLTREKDMAYTLDERVAASNAAGAEILVSLHAAPGAATRVYIQELIDEPGTQRTEPMSGDFLAFETGEEHKELLWGKQQAAHARGSGALGRKLAQQLAGRDSAEPVQASLALLKAADAAAVMIETGLEMDRTHAAEAVVRGIELYVRENR